MVRMRCLEDYENFKYLNIFRQLNKFKLNKTIAKLNTLSKFLPVSKKILVWILN